MSMRREINNAIRQAIGFGLRIVPLRRGASGEGKEPAVKGWQKLPLRDPLDCSDAALSRDFKCNYGIILDESDIVIDVDPRNFPEGKDILKEFETQFSVSLTTICNHIVRTQGGGYHFYFRKPENGDVVNELKVFRGIEFKSKGRFMVGPGSRNPKNGSTWRWHENCTIGWKEPVVAELPDAIWRAIVRADKVSCDAARMQIVRLDEPNNIEFAKTWLAQQEPAEEGNRDNTAYRVACGLHDYALGKGTILTLLSDWNETCSPPLPERDIKRITESACRNAQYPPGNKLPEAYFDDLDEIDKILGTALAPRPNNGIVFRRYSDIEPKPISWLWPERIAKGKITMIAGDPGLGKSQLTCSLAAIVTTGQTWPASTARSEVGQVIILSAEDDAADTIGPRLEAVGGDRTKIYELVAVRTGDAERSFNLKDDLNELSRLLTEIGDVSLVVIDPITAYLAGIDSYKQSDVRSLLSSLSKLASEHNVAIVCVNHLNKGGSNQAMMRVNGSLAFMAAARAGYLVTKDPDDPERRLFLPMKNNIGIDLGGFSFRVVGHDLSNGIKTSRLEWGHEQVKISANEALAASMGAGMAVGEASGPRAEEKKFLSNLLNSGPMPAEQVYSDAKENGFSKSSIRRAANDLRVQNKKIGFGADGGWLWSLPAKMLNDNEDAQSVEESLFGEAEHLKD